MSGNETGPLRIGILGAASPEDAVENMTVIDAIYRAAGLPLREPT